MALKSQLTASLVCFLYSSVFEWVGHRFFMHVRRFPLAALFDAHVHEHHRHYRRERFEAFGPEYPTDVTLDRWSFPLIILGHTPIFLLFQMWLGLPTFWGAVAGGSAYYAAYEVLHYSMHVPRGRYVERLRWFRFLKEHHRIHHNTPSCNFNVLLPLGDLCFGTLVTAGPTHDRIESGATAAVRERIPGPKAPKTDSADSTDPVNS